MSLPRAGLVVNFTYIVTLLAPLAALLSFRLAHRRRFAQHRRLQLLILAVCFLSVLALETKIRLAGGSGALLKSCPPQSLGMARRLLGVHISAAVLTYAAWAWLARVSTARFRESLPGSFSRRHRLSGWLIFAGLCFTAISATGMYVLAFT